MTDKQPPHVSIFSLLLFLLLASVIPAQAGPSDKVVLHLTNPQKMTMLVNNVSNLRKALGNKADIAVVVNGPAVARFSKLSPSREQLDKILEQKASVNICSISLKNKNIKKEMLFDGTTYLMDGGAAKLVELQTKGYAYIKP